MAKANPFRPHSPIWRPSDFYGRSKEARRVLGSLRKGQSVSIVGPSKCGKTSLLNYISDIEIFQRHALLAGKHVFVRIDTTDVRGQSLADVEQDECFFCLREEITHQIKESNVTIADKLKKATRQAVSQSAYFGLTTLFRTAHENDMKPIVTLDNFDALTKNTRLTERFFQALRFFATGHYGMAYLIVSRHPLHKLEKIRIEASPLFNIFHQIVLGPFTSKESHELVNAILKRSDIQFPAFAIDYVLKLGHNEPYRLQLAGYHAFEIWQEKGARLQEADCREIKRRFGVALSQ